jgi:hypothetical protein
MRLAATETIHNACVKPSRKDVQSSRVCVAKKNTSTYGTWLPSATRKQSWLIWGVFLFMWDQNRLINVQVYRRYAQMNAWSVELTKQQPYNTHKHNHPSSDTERLTATHKHTAKSLWYRKLIQEKPNLISSTYYFPSFVQLTLDVIIRNLIFN